MPAGSRGIYAPETNHPPLRDGATFATVQSRLKAASVAPRRDGGGQDPGHECPGYRQTSLRDEASQVALSGGLRRSGLQRRLGSTLLFQQVPDFHQELHVIGDRRGFRRGRFGFLAGDGHEQIDRFNDEEENHRGEDQEGQQRYNVDPLRPTQRQANDNDESPSVLKPPTLTTQPATTLTTRPSTRPATAPVIPP